MEVKINVLLNKEFIPKRDLYVDYIKIDGWYNYNPLPIKINNKQYMLYRGEDPNSYCFGSKDMILYEGETYHINDGCNSEYVFYGETPYRDEQPPAYSEIET